MKKVLALVLAVIMVCTMAMAVEIGTATEATTPNYDSNNQHLGHVLPGKSIIAPPSLRQPSPANTIRPTCPRTSRCRATPAALRGIPLFCWSRSARLIKSG